MGALQIARQYIDGWNARDAARLVSTFRPGGTYEDPNTGAPLKADALARYASDLWAAFPDLEFEEAELRRCGEGEVLFAWTMKGTNKGSLRGLPPTGASVALPGVDLIDACGDGVARVRGFFDRQTLMQQLGAQVVVQPHSAGPVRFGVCTQVRSDSKALPGVVVLTMIDARSDAEVQQIRDVSRRIMLELRGMPGFLSFQGAVVGHRLTTVTLWENREAARAVMREANHKQASAEMFEGIVGSGFHASAWTPVHQGPLWMRCETCGDLRDAREMEACACGTGQGDRAAFW